MNVSSSDDAKPVIALAIGDPAGVGPELAAKLVADPDVRAAASRANFQRWPPIHRLNGLYLNSLNGIRARASRHNQIFVRKALLHDFVS